MAVSNNISLGINQSQQLVMTQQLQQAIKLLQMSSHELAEFVDEEIEKNPLLSREDESGVSEDQSEVSSDTGGDSASESEHPKSGEDSIADSETHQEMSASEALDADYENVWSSSEPVNHENSFSDSGFGQQGSSFDLVQMMEQTVAGEVTLREHLLGQLHVDVSDPALLMISRYLIDMVDDGGYITDDLSNLPDQLGCQPYDIETAVNIIQGFEPVGVGARSLSECLALQLKERDRLDPAMQTLLDNLDAVAAHDYDLLQKRCAVSRDDLRDMCDEIRQLDPKPGSCFLHDTASAVVADVFVKQDKQGDWHIELNTEALPRVLVNRQYYAQIIEKTTGKEDRSYLADRMQSANWLSKALDQRAHNILAVASEIVSQQKRFFQYGIRYLKPMVLRDIAEATQLHESTVSRVTANKFMQTPRGLFEMKYFFTSGVSATTGSGDHSSEFIKYRIKQLIDDELPQEILSDDTLASLLQSEGIDVARRTVAKYREAAGIGSSVQRRREKKMLHSNETNNGE